MEVTINEEDIEMIEAKLPDLANWLANNFESVSAQVIILNSIFEGLDAVKKEMENFNNN